MKFQSITKIKMGRSVNYLRNADAVYFHQLEDEEMQDFDLLIEDIQEHVIYKYPEFEAVDKWEDRDVNIILQSDLVEIALSEYCGVISLSVRTLEEADQTKAASWIEHFFKRAIAPWAKARKIGTFSNGESVYETI
jgi:hypothetical protein